MPEGVTTRPADTQAGPSTFLLAVLAVATGSLVANLYYAQPLIAQIGPEIGVSPDLAGSVVSVTQIGYGTGLFLLVSLGDLVENRRLVLTTLSCLTLALIAVATSSNALVFFVASFVVGLCSTGAQVLLPFVAYLVPEARRGRVLGNIMACVLTGVMLARPVSLFIAASFGWRAVFWWSACLMVMIGLSLARMMPRYAPRGGISYSRILVSMIALFRATPVLRWQSASQALIFGGFNLFWTAAPLMLAGRFGLSQEHIALFALAGAGGALAAPFAGRLADRGLGRRANVAAVVLLGLTFYSTRWAVSAGLLSVLVVLTILLDAAVQTTQIISRRMIFAVPPETRGRANAIYMTCLFSGGSVGSIVGTLTYHSGGWTATATAGGLIGLMVIGLIATRHRVGA
jgi:predicted MFS family arabinose efflux permease